MPYDTIPPRPLDVEISLKKASLKPKPSNTLKKSLNRTYTLPNPPPLPRSAPTYDKASLWPKKFGFYEFINKSGFRSLPQPSTLSGLSGGYIGYLWDTGWAYGKVSPIDPTTLNPSRKAEIESMGANFWVRYDDGFYPQKLERKAYLKEGIFADDVEVGTWCIVERFKKKRKRKKD